MIGHVLNSLPRRPEEAIAQLIYVNGATEPSYAVLHCANGPVMIKGQTWRLLQLLQRSGSRFV